MRRGGIVVLVIILVISLALVIGVLYLFRSNFSANDTASIESCKLAVDQKFFPSTIREYKLANSNSKENQLNALYKSNSSAFWLSLSPESNYFGADNRSEENLKNQEILIKAWRGEGSQEELDNLGKKLGDSSFRIEEVDGLKVVVLDYSGSAEGPPFNVQFTDKDTAVHFNMGFFEKIPNYKDYISAWKESVCQ